jgi:cytochrome c-type biogenesis protein CcmF
MTSLLHVFGDTFPAFGASLLLGAMVVASYTFAVALAAGSNGKPRTLQAARFGAYGTVALIGTAVVCLAYAFVTHDFRIRYVAHYSDRSMPMHYLFTALWGGQDGSLLWWLFLLSAYIGVCVMWLGKRYLELQPYVIATLMAIVLFFCILMAFAANPFATNIAGPRADGDGLNPALQNYWMVIHPPCLYTGFVGCSVPFAFGVAALVTGRLDHEWIVASRKWTLFCWMFLGIGNTLGMLWAYESLGWGGYWGWDPVENAAFMPFLVASAYVHSVMIQERRGMLKVWNVFLVFLMFFLTIFGTFLTRSGMIASVHAFAQSSIGNYFAVFLGIIIVFAATLVLWRWPELRDLPPSTRLRRAAVASGWLVIAACGPGLAFVWRLALPVSVRVTMIAAIAGAAVFVALEVVFRRMTAGLALKARRPRIESILSREFTFVLNNWILCSLLFFILVATTFPLISEALTGEKVTVGPPFYKAWVQPLGLTLLVLMGVGTLFGWKKTSPEALRRSFRVPVGAAVVAAVLHFALGHAVGFPAVVWSDPIYTGALGAGLRVFNAFTPVAGFSLCVFNAAVIVQEFALLLRARARAGSEKTPAILWWLGGVPGLVHTLSSLPAPSRRRYGGYIVHFGIVLMFLGFTGQSWNVDREASLYPGQTYVADDYTLSYVGARMEVDNTKRMVFADVDVYKHGKLEARLSPGKFIYKKQPDSPTTEVAIGHGLRDDVYLIVGSINPSNKNLAAFQLHINPLVSWIWIGCIVLIMGSLVSMWPQIEFGESRIWAGARGVAATAASVIFGIMLAATPAAHAQTMSGQHNGTVHVESDSERSIFGSLRCMCGTCARDLLSTCTCETAAEARDKIREKMRAGEARDQIIAEYAADYGPEALAVPPNNGVFRAIWVVPVAGIGLGALGLARFMKKWRGGSGPSAKSGPGGQPNGEADPYDSRLDDELKDLDD